MELYSITLKVAKFFRTEWKAGDVEPVTYTLKENPSSLKLSDPPFLRGYLNKKMPPNFHSTMTILPAVAYRIKVIMIDQKY